jgi:hypothetical protein
MIAIRENETLAESVGIPTWHDKLVVFMIGAAFAGRANCSAHFSGCTRRDRRHTRASARLVLRRPGRGRLSTPQ